MRDRGFEQPYKEVGEQHDNGEVQVRRGWELLENEGEELQGGDWQLDETVQKGTLLIIGEDRPDEEGRVWEGQKARLLPVWV